MGAEKAKHRARIQRGFTLVELLIVIVVIAILAAIAISAYRGIQAQARDSQRLTDARTIVQAIKLYHADTGRYPNATSVLGPNDWEQSNEASPFLEELVTTGYLKNVPRDPINNSISYYRYFRYDPGSWGCDVNRGDFFVFGIFEMETTGRPHPKSPGWNCLPTRDWGIQTDWVTGAYR